MHILNIFTISFNDEHPPKAKLRINSIDEGLSKVTCANDVHS